ncbi:MAG TPA: uroporphyrinogen-III C-methyltransferase [Roseateles sp.]|nr:uroporphyrinogen-III C-methyltransferase [Roseateles sp.]HWT54380.1 uroporphyrinogen-III C-methyltransferase [Rhodocyclaceae bacterium]
MSETPVPAPTAAPAARSSPLKQPALVLALVAIALATTTWVANSSRIAGLQEELAKRLSEGDGAIRDSRSDSRQAKEEAQALAARVTLLEAKLNEAQGQQAALESMYQDLARGRDDRLLAEIEQSVGIASQQLQLAGNVEAALIALQSADTRLAQNGNAQFATVRRLIARDIEKLKSLPQADVSGMATRLETVVAVVDTLPLAYAQRPQHNAAKADDKQTAKTAPPAITEGAYWSGLLDGAWNEIKQMVRVERMDKDAPALLAPSQSLFLRENLRLRLVNARLSLLQRDGDSFRDDLKLSVKWLEQYFDLRAPAVKTARDTLQRMSSTNLNLALPALDETLAALRSLRQSREKR